MNLKNRLIVLILSVVLTLLIFKIDNVKPQDCGSSCPDNCCEIECGELVYRNLPSGEWDYHNFTITGGVTEVTIKGNTTPNNNITFNINRTRDNPPPCPYDLCRVCLSSPPPNWYCSCPIETNPIFTFKRNLTAGTYYFIVNHTGGNAQSYQISMNCTRLFSEGVFCCGPPNAKQCYNSGICCLKETPSEYWHPTGCFDFNTWVKPERMMFTLGSKIPVTLYIENKGSYTDAYDVDYEIDPLISSVVKVDMTGATSTGSVAHGEIKKLYPRIMTLYTPATGDVTFNVTSHGDPSLYKTTTLNIIESDFPLSLSEFSIFGLIGMIILAGIVYSSCIER